MGRSEETTAIFCQVLLPPVFPLCNPQPSQLQKSALKKAYLFRSLYYLTFTVSADLRTKLDLLKMTHEALQTLATTFPFLHFLNQLYLVQSSFIHSSQTRNNQNVRLRWPDQQNAIYSCNGLSFSNKKWID